MARFRVVTRHQISGWRFLLRRIEHALVRRDASMLDDPQRGRSTALSVGIALACLVIAGAAVLGFFKPAKMVGSSKIVSEKDTGALYVHLGNRLYPALNLTSARLIVGSADTPVPVSHDELAKYPRGPLVGIPGAPNSIVDAGARDSTWTVCDTSQTGAAAPVDPRTGLPTVARAAMRTTVIGGTLSVDGGDLIRPLGEGEARLLRDDATTWLVYNDAGKGAVRAAVSTSDTAVMLALGIDSTIQVPAASKGLIGAIPEVPPIRVPEIPGAGSTVTLNSGLTVTVGAVLTGNTPDRGASYYVVSQSGVVQIGPVLAAMIRNANARGTVSSQSVGPDVIATNLRPGGWPGTESYPTRALRVVDPARFLVTCYEWSRTPTAQNASTTLLVGRQLPLPADQQNRTVDLVTAQLSHGATADAAYLAGGAGRFVQATGADPSSARRESMFWISDTGVRYGVDVQPGQNGQDPTVTALALRNPVPAPWSIVSLFAVGPTLSQRDARIAHDGIAPDRTVIGFGGTQ
ncbi:ESX-3 secretion system ATPase EccB3 [Nocardia sp. RB56]|uniref:ESX-3 secretion system ATPase EccB3 n=1 Tax=Nocardia aurantia TaxID=2585199 RepID=A0A7K0DRR4_9NOCA|nr:ESX-3 secretion system ATPase EccB3 [Nocardia aurantia]